MLMNTRDHYGLITRLLHWLTVALVIAMLLGGSVLPLIPSGGFKTFVVTGHKSIGVIVLSLMLVRLLWRNTNPRPQFLAASPVLNYIAQTLHVTLYILLILQPLTGILMSQAYGYPVAVFGGFELPALVWQSPSLGGFFRQVHGVTAVILIVAIVIHAAAALKHHFIDGDRTLMRMVKGS